MSEKLELWFGPELVEGKRLKSYICLNFPLGAPPCFSVSLRVICYLRETSGFRGIFVDFFDKIDGAVLRFLVDAEDIFADDTQEDQLDGSQKIEAQEC